ncbi:hypothetical protein DFH09DRAFT_1283778 [Mycena vulgaris]|nr:hypothetical protein DFH09DRAFT_1283778 [Mycena vulgaris]
MTRTPTTIHIRFERLACEYTASSWSIPNHHEPFEPLLTNAIVIAKDQSLIFNRGGDRLPRKVEFEEARTWGLDDGDSSLVYGQAQSSDGATHFCLRLLLNAEETARDPKSSAFCAYARLLTDAKFHSKYLVKAEGVLVPLHYGLWLMDTGDWGGKVLCSITQWCGRSWYDLSRTDSEMNTEANKILVGRTLEALHDYGVTHGGVKNPSDLRHIILDIDAPWLSQEDRRNGRALCYVVDFAAARFNHGCARKLPVLPLDAFVNAEDVGCSELVTVAYLLKFVEISKLTPSSDTYKALKWHANYSNLYPAMSNCDVLIAQRAKLFHHMPPLYPELRVSFEGIDEYGQVIIEQDPESDEDVETLEDDTNSTSPETVAASSEVLVEFIHMNNSEVTSEEERREEGKGEVFMV